ncbi:family 20 glycosylhydrolase [Elizabethkingia miricola]|uniref:family 20 glycosylhydrolase n=1 Tax=Elizabethkingia miricola TaxID=172045 RepID=UPI002ACE329A|nr:family 20 glycosylhydrolase [Elizabethkingia miricola]WQM39449.1 family 20 glycosylhydrolase [Elizabethkingia miricola]
MDKSSLQIVNVIPLPYKTINTLSNTNGKLTISDLDDIDAPKEMLSIIDAFIQDVAVDGGPNLNKSSKGVIKIKINNDSKFLTEVPNSLGKSPQKSFGGNEKYALEVNSKGIFITAKTILGAYRGLTTFRQLLITANKSNDGTIVLDPIKIIDGPKLGWRSFKLDVARYYVPIPEIKKIIDQLALYKYNILSLHITDNEGWKIEIKSHPRLTSQTKDFYTQEEIKSLVSYAANRGIMIIPETDFPGYSSALLKAYPEFGKIQEIAERIIAYVDPNVVKSWDLFEDVAKELKDITGSQYLRFGGDEAFEMSDELYHQFVTEALRRLKKLNIIPIGFQEITRAGIMPGIYTQIWKDFADSGGDLEKWEELVKEENPLPEGLPPEALPFYHKVAEDFPNALKQVAVIIASPTKKAYFDTPYAEVSNDANQEKNRANLGMRLYSSQTLEQFYNWKPSTILYGLPLEQLGGVEAAMWCDTIKENNSLWELMLSRIPGFAERAWSIQDNLTWENYRKRLSFQSINWKARNLNWFQSSLVDWK